MMNDPYSVLGISASASDDEVKRAYRDLARKYHPDNYQNNPLADLAEEKMKEINEAYDAINRMRGGGGYSGAGTAGAYRQGTYRQSTGAGDPAFARVRALINAGNLDEAEQILQNAPSRNAEWHFLAGSIAYRRGWLDEAQQNYQYAVQMDPANPEYRQALAYMQNAGGMYRNYGGMNTAECDSADICTGLMCLNCLCRGGRC